jgi:hypothetical protein
MWDEEHPITTFHVVFLAQLPCATILQYVTSELPLMSGDYACVCTVLRYVTPELPLISGDYVCMRAYKRTLMTMASHTR